jgi:hypothetical protein
VRWSAALADPAGPREFWAQRRVCLLGTVRAAPEAVDGATPSATGSPGRTPGGW